MFQERVRKKRKKTGAREEARQARREELATRAECTYPEGHTCCKGRACSRKWTPAAVQAIRHSFRKHKGIDRRAWTKRHLQETETIDGEVSKEYFLDLCASTSELHCAVGPQARPQVCLEWFTFVLGVSTTFIYQPHIPERTFQVELTGRVNTKRDKTNAVVAWLLELAKWACLEPDTDQIALPFASWKSVHDLYMCEQRSSGFPKVSATHFKRVRRKENRVRHLVLRRYLRFAKCDECVDFRRQRNATRDPEKLIVIRKKEYAHKCLVREERGSYWRRRDKARRNPERYMSIIIDGADQSAFGVPHFREKDHTTQGAFTMGVKIMGAIVHGFGAFAFTHLDHVKSGANATMDVLVRVLQIYKDERGQLPPKLYLQLDNTVKQCKNKFLMSFLAMLVEHGVFEECVVSFLPVGHTHEDIDQMFSRFAVALRKADFHSRLGLAAILEGAYHMRTGEAARVFHMSRWTNFSEWLTPHIKAAEFIGITKYRQFMIGRNGSGESVIQVREYCAQKEFEQFKGILSKRFFTRPWTHLGAPTLQLTDMPAAQRRTLKAPQAARDVESSSDESSSDDEDGKANKKQSEAEEVRARTQKVHKVRKGCERLMKVKKTGDTEKASLLDDLDLLCGAGSLHLDLPHGEAALEHIAPPGPRHGDLMDARLDLQSEEQTVMMRSGYALAPGMTIAVLVDPESQDIHQRWEFGEVVAIDWGKAEEGQDIDSQPIVKVQYFRRTNSKKKEAHYRRTGGSSEFIAPECIQCEVEFTKFNSNIGGKLKAVCVKDTLQFFLDLANERSASEDEDDEDSQFSMSD